MAEGDARGAGGSAGDRVNRGERAKSLPVTIVDVLAWDRERGEPPLDRGFTPEQQARMLARFG